MSMVNVEMDLDDRFILRYDELQFKKEIGSGAFGAVFKGVWRSSTVAVKVIKNVSISQQEKAEFLKEIKVMSRMRPHPNIVQFLGMCLEPLCIITEFLERGSLYHFLRSETECPSELQWKIIRGIGAGMLHLSSEGLVHRDLAARNVLLNASLTPAVSDFGMSRLAEENAAVYSKADVGPLKWMAPESLQSKLYSQKTDVWAFGVTVIEVLTREDPWPGMEGFMAATKTLNKETPPFPATVDPGLAQLLKECFVFEPAGRPTFQQICSRIEQLMPLGDNTI